MLCTSLQSVRGLHAKQLRCSECTPSLRLCEQTKFLIVDSIQPFELHQRPFHSLKVTVRCAISSGIIGSSLRMMQNVLQLSALSSIKL